MRWFNRKHHSLGIDITADTIKCLELSLLGNRYKVESYAIAPLFQGTAIDNEAVNIEIIAEAIKVALKQSGTRQRQVCVAIPKSAIVTKVVTMSAGLSTSEMEEEAMIEAERHTPYALDQIYLDFEAWQVNEAKPEMMDVLLVIARKENVDGRVETLKMAGLTASVVDVESFAVERSYALLKSALPNDNNKQTVAMVDIGASMTILNILQDGRTIYTREQHFGGKHLTGEIQQRYGLSYQQAELAKRQGDLPDDYNSEVLESFKHALVQRVTKSLQFFISSNINSRIESIVLAGGCAYIPSIDKLIAEKLDIPVMIANPFINMSLSHKIKPQNLSNDATTMMVACGLALRGFDS